MDERNRGWNFSCTRLHPTVGPVDEPEASCDEPGDGRDGLQVILRAADQGAFGNALNSGAEADIAEGPRRARFLRSSSGDGQSPNKVSELRV